MNSTHTSPKAATLVEQIATAVEANPGISTNLLCKQVKVRKSDVLAELERLRQNQFLRFENGPRASKCWYAVSGQGNQFLTLSQHG